MLTNQEKYVLLENILKHPDFTSSATYKKLLKYLVESTINNIQIKEYSIALEVFEKDAEFNPAEDSSVRVYVSNLRKKLENYYNNSGKKAKYRIQIPAGHYEVEFVKTPSLKLGRTAIHKIHRITYPLLTLIIAYLIYTNNNTQPQYSFSNIDIENTFWNDVVNSKLPVKIVIGDDIFFIEDPRVLDTSLENPYSVQSIVRKHFINSEQEFLNYKQENKNDKDVIIKDITTYKFFPFHSISSIPAISRLFKSLNDFTLEYSSALHAHDFLDNNIIFLGSFRNLYNLDQALDHDKINYQVKYVNSFLQINTEDSLMTFTVSGAPDTVHVDYCLVRNVPGPNNNNILLFITFYEAAMEAATTYLLNQQTMDELTQKFEKKLGYMPKYFNIVFKSSGFERTSYTTTVEYIDEIDEKTLSIW